MKNLLLLILSIVSGLLPLQAQDTDSIQSALQNYQYNEALEMLYKIDNKTVVHLKQIAIAHKSLNQFQKALKVFQSAFAEDSADLTLLVEIGECYRFLGNDTKALELYQEYTRKTGGNQYTDLQIANCLYNMDRFEHAVDRYHRLLKKDTTLFLVRRIAQCYEKNDIEMQAMIYYGLAVDLAPYDKQSVYALSTLFLKNNYFMDGIKITNEYIKFDPNNSSINFMNGLHYYYTQNFDTAILRLQHCMSAGDRSLKVYKMLGKAYYKNQDYFEAIPMLQYVADVDTSDIELNYILAKSYYNTNNSKCIDYYQKVKEILIPTTEQLTKLTNDFYDAYCSLGQYLDAIKTLDELEEIISESNKNLPTKMHELSEIYYKKSNHYITLKEYEKALKTIDQGISLVPEKFTLYSQKARILNKYFNDKQGAIACYEKIIELSNNDKGILKSSYTPQMIEYYEQQIKLLKEELFFEKEKLDTALNNPDS